MLPVFYFPLPIAIGTQISAEINQIYSDIFVFFNLRTSVFFQSCLLVPRSFFYSLFSFFLTRILILVSWLLALKSFFYSLFSFFLT